MHRDDNKTFFFILFWDEKTVNTVILPLGHMNESGGKHTECKTTLRNILNELTYRQHKNSRLRLKGHSSRRKTETRYIRNEWDRDNI